MSAYAIVPVDVTASITTNIYDDAPEWLGTTTYAEDEVIKKTAYAFYNGVPTASSVSIFKSLVNGNFGNIPLTHSTAYWLYIGEATPAYASDTVYAVGHRVTSARLIYESLIDGTLISQIFPRVLIQFSSFFCFGVFSVLSGTTLIHLELSCETL